jgi:phospholipase/carboxylesterase
MVEVLDGPRRSPARGKPDSLVVVLHGYGASGDDLFPLTEIWSQSLPGASFVAPHAPERMPYPGMAAFQWFPLTLRDPEEYIRGTKSAATVLDAFLDAELARYGLPPDRLVIVGFSQGTMMALHVGLRRKVAPAAIVGFSGVIAGARHLGDEVTCRPPVLLVHGAEDEVIPVAAINLTREALAACGVPVEWHVRERLGHGIDDAGIELAAGFLRQHLATGAGLT